MRRNRLTILLLAMSTLGAFLAGDASGACNWQAVAAAGVTAYNGGVVSDHYGQSTRVDCINSRSLILRANTFHDSVQVWQHEEVGGAAVLGNSIIYSIGFPSCNGYWTSSTRFGTTYLGLIDWHASDARS
jgi:hypothetical protein